MLAVLPSIGGAVAAEFPLSGDKVVGQVQEYVVQSGDKLADLARKFDVGYTEMLAANPGVDPWLPKPGTRLILPTLFMIPDVPRQGIVLNLGERRLYYFPPGGATVETYPIGIGAIGFETPNGTTRVVRKEPNPTWIPTKSARDENPDLPAVVEPGPDNPLGDYALRLGWTNYLLHGTNKPDGVGRNVSHGCIRLYPEDIDRLFHEAAVGTPVRVVDQAADAAWIGNGLYVEAHPSKQQADQIDVEQPMTPETLANLRQIVSAAAGDYAQAVDWSSVGQEDYRRTGRPVQVAARGAVSGGTAAEMSSAQPIPLVPQWSQPQAAPQVATRPPPASQMRQGQAMQGQGTQSLTPIFNTLQPPPGAVVPPPRDAVGIATGYPPARAGYDDEGTLRALPAPPAAYAPLDSGAAYSPLPDSGAAYSPLPDTGAAANPAADDPNAAYNARFTGPGSYDSTNDTDRPAWDRGYRR